MTAINSLPPASDLGTDFPVISRYINIKPPNAAKIKRITLTIGFWMIGERISYEDVATIPRVNITPFGIFLFSNTKDNK